MNTSNGKILRFNTNTDFSNTSGYTVFNSKARLGQYVSNFFDGVIAEHFIIFIPQSYGIFLRFDTNQDFTNVSSYTMYDANSTFGILYAGSGCYDGSKFAYFPVYYNGPGIGVRLKSSKSNMFILFFFFRLLNLVCWTIIES